MRAFGYSNLLMKLIPILVCGCLAAMALSGCGEGRTRPPRVGVTVVNAAPGFANVCFLRGRRKEVDLPFRQVGSAVFDVDAYQYHIATTGLTAASDCSLEIGALSDTLQADTAYLYVVTQPVWSDPAVEVIRLARPVFSATNANAELMFVHAASTQPAVDVYVTPPGTDLATATPIGTASYRGTTAPVTLTPATALISITAAGDPANVLFTSISFTIPAGTSTPLVLVDGADEGTANLAVIGANDTGTTLIDVNTQSAVRIINGASDRAARDVFLNDDFTAPFAANVAFGVPTDMTPIVNQQNKITLTPVGNPSTIEGEVTSSYGAGTPYTLVFSGAAGALEGIAAGDNFRVVYDRAYLQVINAVNHVELVTFYVEAPGTDLTAAIPTFGLESPGISARVPFTLAEHEITLKDFATGTVLFGPQTFDMSSPGIYTLVAVDNADGTTADVVLMDDFQ
jgi:hypothetical protein